MENFREGKYFTWMLSFGRCMLKCIRCGRLVTLLSSPGPWLCRRLLPPPGNANQYCVLLAPKRPCRCTSEGSVAAAAAAARVPPKISYIRFFFVNMSTELSEFGCLWHLLAVSVEFGKRRRRNWCFLTPVRALEQGSQGTLFGF